MQEASPKTHADLVRIFHTALVTSRAAPPRDYSKEIFELMETPAFQAILRAIEDLSHSQGLTERQASTQVIAAFRKADQLWGDYLFQEGVDHLKGSLDQK